MEINFNNPHIINGYLEQEIPKFGLEEIKGIVVGEEGGLGYCLFTDHWFELETNFYVSSTGDMKNVGDYFDAVQSFVNQWEKHAEGFGFKLVHIHPISRIISNGLESELYIYSTGIGDETIDNSSRVEQFIEMVKDGHTEIQEGYNRIEKLSSAFQEDYDRLKKLSSAFKNKILS